MTENKFMHFFHRMSSKHRLLFSFSAGLLSLLMVIGKAVTTKFMVSWLVFSTSLIVLFWITFLSATTKEITVIARRQDSSRPVIFLIVLGSAFISLFAIVLMLRQLPNTNESGYYAHLILSVCSVGSSWILIHSVFTVRYAHMYYQRDNDPSNGIKQQFGGLNFPGEADPDYLDFAYFSFVIGMTFQVSDVEISSSHIRRIALIHGVLSFAFNAVIVALCINIISGIVQN